MNSRQLQALYDRRKREGADDRELDRIATDLENACVEEHERRNYDRVSSIFASLRNQPCGVQDHILDGFF